MPDFNETKTSIDDDSLDQDSSKYLRIYLKGYTAVVYFKILKKFLNFINVLNKKNQVQKRAITLKEALQNKLKLNNLNIDKCLPIIKESKYLKY